MRQHLLRITASVCLLLAVGHLLVVAATWDEAYWCTRSFDVKRLELRLCHGQIFLSITRGWPQTPQAYWRFDWVSKAETDRFFSAAAGGAVKRSGRMGFLLMSGSLPTKQPFTLLHVPGWVLLIPLLLLPAWWAIKAIMPQHQSEPTLCCPVCGYDLRECRESCSECGWIMPYEVAFRNAVRRTNPSPKDKPPPKDQPAPGTAH